MTCRRKTKSERELVADINKTFTKYCGSQNSCNTCKYQNYNECVIEYLKDLLKKEKEEIMRSKVETITINLRADYAHQLVLFLGAQCIKDTEYIIDKYNLKMNKKEMDDIIQHLFNQLACELELEL